MSKYYTVGQVSKETGVTKKTLYHYQKIKLLVPSKIGDNGYRYYSEEDIKLLQEILLYRTMNFPLKEIEEILSNKDSTSRIERLEKQKSLLSESINELQIVMNTIDKTILLEKGREEMSHKEMFNGVEKDDDSIYRTMQNLTIIFMKPFTAVFFILGLALTIVYTKALINGSTIFEVSNTVSSLWINIIFLLIGIGTTLVSGYILFFTSTKKQLKLINEKYMK